MGHEGQGAPVRQRTVGIIGGVSDVATVEYYRKLNAHVRAMAGGANIARTLVDGLNVAEVIDWLTRGDEAAMEAAFEEAVDRLLRAGADTVLCASNTCHKALDAIAARRDFPHIHIADATAAALREAGVRRAVLLGSMETMEEPFLRQRLSRHGVETVVPAAADRREVDRVIFEELVEGRFRARSRLAYVSIARHCMAEQGAQGVILGCTEIGQLVGQADMPDVPVFDTTDIHCRAAARFALARARSDRAVEAA